MKKTLNRIASVIMLLAILSLACSLPTATPGITSAPPEVTKPAKTVTPQITAASTVKLGAEQRVEMGGFSFQPPQDYAAETASDFGMATLLAPGANKDEGPFMLLAGGASESTTTLESLYETFKSQQDFTLSTPKNITVGGKPGLEGEFTAKSSATSTSGEDISGKIVVVQVSPTQQFTMIGGALKNLWNGDAVAAFDAVLMSVKFFEMKLPTIEPTAQEATLEQLPTLAETLLSTLELPTVEPTSSSTKSSGDGLFHQWAAMATASSEYGNPEWSADQATGKPNSGDCGDHNTAWASLDNTTEEWIQLVYSTPVTPTEINIYETYNPGFISKVEVIDLTAGYHTVYTATPQAVSQCPRELTIKVENADYQIATIVITIKQAGGWDEIDAVELVGKK